MAPRIDPLFVTRLYAVSLAEERGYAALNTELAEAIAGLAAEDRAGRAWAKAHGYRGYTSYASLNDLPRRATVFADLKRRLDRHVAAFATACDFDLGIRRLKLDSLWVNVLRPGGAHSGHLHPGSVVSGTLYVTVPEGAGAIRFEDPRLPMMMGAPMRRRDAPESAATFVRRAPEPGLLLLWESWLRHEVEAHAGRGERVSVSFNYG